MSRFGDFGDICTNVPSYTWCNLFYRQLSETSNLSSILTGVSSNPTSAPVGVNPSCGIPRVGSNGSVGNIGNIVVCALSMIVVIALISLTERRKAAVGRVELRNLLVMYFITLPFQLITNGSLLEQGSTVLVVLTAIHAALVVEDGTMASLAPFYILSFLIFGGTLYIALDVALGITQTLGPSSNPTELLSIPLFIMTSFWPLLAAILYLSIMLYIILAMLKESRPTLYYILAGVAFVFSQLAWFLLGKVICVSSGSKLDGSFLATMLETITVVLIFFGWKSITEGAWDETYY
ncbi:chitin synthase III catalytic subunit [Lentinula guzmanii]|uniref:Chitin synthase III catalytic subunit n=1 Tax=Lentinula guzmanii TaxID=2804957 RepID=A0AA38J8U7_9AGAR|nr:chitin synthase III catalytic subunit [Lentinula guzmanii]